MDKEEGQNGKRNKAWQKEKFKLDQNPPQDIFEGVHRLRMANVRIPFAGWQNCEAQFS
jgi:hypothetical protein